MNFDAINYAMDKVGDAQQGDDARKAEVMDRIEQALGLQFSEEQRAVIQHSGSPLAVIACAGAGKTTVILAKLFFRELYHGVAPHNMLAISYNTKAKEELEERYGRMKVKLGIRSQSKPTFKTFHGLFYGFVQRFVGQFRVANQGAYNYELTKEIPYSQYQDKKDILQQIKDKRSSLINNSLSYDGIHSASVEGAKVNLEEESFEPEVYYRVIDKYNEMKRQRGEVDFDDMLVYMHHAVVKQPNSALIAAFQQAYQEVYIDEYQDISEIMINIMDALIGDKNRMTVIGDDDQTIYAYQGAKDYFILNFHLRYQGATTLFLGDNYRCPSNILNPIIPSIQMNTGRLDKQIRAYNEGGTVCFYPVGSDFTPLVEALLDEVELSNGQYDDIAILVRTNAQKTIYSDILGSQSIPVDVGNKSYVLQENRIYKAVMGIIKAIRERDNKLFSEYGRQFLPGMHYMVIKNYSKGNAGNWFVDVIENDRYLINKETRDYIQVIATTNNAADIIRHVWILTREYHERNASRGFGNLDTVVEVFKYMVKTAENLTYDDYYAQEIRKYMFTSSYVGTNHAVKIQTMHSVKGLEYNTVFLVGLDANIFPNEQFLETLIRKGDHKRVERYIADERRLLYVGWTRAKKRLYVAFNEKNPCMFLEEVAHPQLQEILKLAKN